MPAGPTGPFYGVSESGREDGGGVREVSNGINLDHADLSANNDGKKLSIQGMRHGGYPSDGRWSFHSLGANPHAVDVLICLDLSISYSCLS